MKTKPSFRRALLCVLSLGLPASILAQGSLTPPAAPTPTMKSLDQVRSTGIALNAANTPGDANYHYILSQAGSYFLTANLAVTKASGGIHVTGPGVTIDLNGFQILRTSGAGGDGITVDSTSHRCTIKGGTISSFDYGVNCLTNAGVTPRSGLISEVSLTACNITAIKSGDGWRLQSCSVHDSAGAIGGGNANTIDHCTATHTANGISGSSGSTISNCAAVSNTGGLAAISVSFGTVVNCTAYLNQTVGILVGNGSLVQGCTVNYNTGDGIKATSNCLLTGNVIQTNSGNGIETTSINNRIDSNLCIANTGYGVKSFGPTADFIMRNTCYQNSGAVVAGSDANYSPNSGAYFGVLSTPGAASPSPWANF